ncbi:MAG TPA: lipopolysaccharide assembly protein LapA domain-containing protein [Hyphomicrobiaceae bacterium]|nr:lipopolysaccharide assembly protein LapA domain-containing protein [Hyphomicrobiaceae bacterium]
MLRRILRLLVLLPAVIVLAALGVTNTHGVRLALNPFRPDDPVLAVTLPFYAWLLAAMIVGVLLGGLVTWATHYRWRLSARRGEAEARRWKAEAERLNRERHLGIVR